MKWTFHFRPGRRIRFVDAENNTAVLILHFASVLEGEIFWKIRVLAGRHSATIEGRGAQRRKLTALWPRASIGLTSRRLRTMLDGTHYPEFEAELPEETRMLVLYPKGPEQ